MLSKGNVLILVPALNEEGSVGAVLENLIRQNFHVLLISDGSTDATADIGRSIGVSVLELPINLGVGGALRAGFKFADRKRYEAIVQVDGDGQHPAEEIEHLIETANSTNAHMVIGSRFLSETATLRVSRIRRIAMKLLSSSASAASGSPISDSTSGFRLIRQPLLGQFAIQFANNYLGDTYESVISAGRGNYSIIEIPASLRPREIGESSASTSSAVRFTFKGLGVALLRMHKKLKPFSD